MEQNSIVEGRSGYAFNDILQTFEIASTVAGILLLCIALFIVVYTRRGRQPSKKKDDPERQPLLMSRRELEHSTTFYEWNRPPPLYQEIAALEQSFLYHSKWNDKRRLLLEKYGR